MSAYGSSSSWFARCVPTCPFNAMSLPVVTVSQGPESFRKPPDQPPIRERQPASPRLSSRGDWMLAVSEKLCSRSAAQLPSSNPGSSGML